MEDMTPDLAALEVSVTFLYKAENTEHMENRIIYIVDQFIINWSPYLV